MHAIIVDSEAIFDPVHCIIFRSDNLVTGSKLITLSIMNTENLTGSKSRFFIQCGIKIDHLAKMPYRHSTKIYLTKWRRFGYVS